MPGRGSELFRTVIAPETFVKAKRRRFIEKMVEDVFADAVDDAGHACKGRKATDKVFYDVRKLFQQNLVFSRTFPRLPPSRGVALCLLGRGADFTGCR